MFLFRRRSRSWFCRLLSFFVGFSLRFQLFKQASSFELEGNGQDWVFFDEKNGSDRESLYQNLSFSGLFVVISSFWVFPKIGVHPSFNFKKLEDFHEAINHVIKLKTSIHNFLKCHQAWSLSRQLILLDLQSEFMEIIHHVHLVHQHF